MNHLRFVYGLVDPRDGQIRYVGQTSIGMKRPKTHALPSRLKSDGHTHKANWIRQLLSTGHRYEIVVLYRGVGLTDTAEAERFWIKHLRDRGCDLTNSSDGGEYPATGCIPSPATRARLSASHKGKVPHAFTPESREKMRVAKIGNKNRLGKGLR